MTFSRSCKNETVSSKNLCVICENMYLQGLGYKKIATLFYSLRKVIILSHPNEISPRFGLHWGKNIGDIFTSQ